ncbi:glycosyltransferase [Pengzhenrongella sicca]|uniref:Glycosyltransferase n=1 Tax=Pengzhenrongella sicca TaxID=2819238 RepID=A0A8A4ZG45_9MICO|nr:glycosyltransferase [Pengzhenrongella sicca]QTE30255.1 glycosyltransferase [Pengzhenrongella sicca]
MTDTPQTSSVPAAQATPIAASSIVAVLVTHGVTSYLPQTLAALAAQTLAPARVVVVDVDADAAPTDDSSVAQLVARLLGPSSADVRVHAAAGARTFGAAVGAGLAGEPAATGWVWLLHDDSAPDPTALAELARAVEHSSSVAVAGVKQRSWTDGARLLEVGVTTSRLGRRVTGIEDGEVDQGQHDGRVDVLAVGLAGALVRREVWDEIRGTDPALGPFGDGLDLCRRARLAGYRVVVVPSAVVRHAQASYLGLRRQGAGPAGSVAAAGAAEGTDLAATDPDPEADTGPEPAAAVPSSAADPGDPRRSFGARRRAQVHARLAAVPLPLLPFLGAGYLLAGVLRCLVRIASKELGLALAELAAPVAALAHPGRMARARAVARRASRLPRRSLRPLQATWRDVLREQRDGHFQRSESRRAGGAPSELERAELAAVTSRRRLTLGVLVIILAALTALALDTLISGVLGGGALAGGALLPASADLGELWRAATSGWVADGLGAPGPADPLLTMLVPVALLAGGATSAAVAALYLGALALAGVGAWFAAGAGTRSVGVRLWAALVWVAAPALTTALDGGRLGAVVAHAALPWVVLAVARAVGVQRYDVVVSGLVGAQRRAARAPDAAAEPSAGPHQVAAGDVPAQDVATVAIESETAAWLGGGEREVWPDSEAAARATDRAAVVAPEPEPGVGNSTDPADQRADRPLGSIGAAAAAGLAFAVVAAGAPVLLPTGLLALLAVAACVPRRRRGRLVLVALPALALFGPTIVEALSDVGGGSWRVLLADPGPPVASTPAAPWQQLLGWPVAPVDGDLAWLPAPVATALPFVLGAVVGLFALLALLRGAAVARGVRLGWFVAACGLGAAFVSAQVETAAGPAVFVRGWSGAGGSLLLLGLLTAAVLGTDRLAARMARYSFGWRQIVVVVLTGCAVLAPAIPLTEWVVRARTDATSGAGASEVSVTDGSVVSAVGEQSQLSADRSRVLALGLDGDGVLTYQLLTSDGGQLTDVAAAVEARGVTGAPGSPVDARGDEAAGELARIAARLGNAASTGAAAELSELAVATVLVPPATGAQATALRAGLVGRLDSTAGLERITENGSGVIWRVVPVAADAATEADAADPDAAADPGVAGASWAKITTPGTDGQRASSTPVAAERLAVDTEIAAGGADRLLVLAERADAGWHAQLDGRPLRSVDSDWRQTFALGADGGQLTVTYGRADRMPWLWLQGAVGLLTLLLALPVRRRRGGTR